MKKTIKENSMFKAAYENNNIPIVLACDNNWALYLYVTIYSIIYNTSKDYNYDIIILETDIKKKNKAKIISLSENYKNVSIRFYDMNDCIKNIKQSFYLNDYFVSIATYYRLFMPQILKNYGKIIYLDTDIIVNTDLSQLYKIDMEDSIIMATNDIQVIYDVNKKNYSRYKDYDFEQYVKEVLNIKDISTYFQAGVMVIDLNKMRDFNVTEKSIDLLERIKSPTYVDQDILNSVCYNNVKIIPHDWDIVTHKELDDYHHMEGYLPDKLYKHIRGKLKPFIVHYTGTKPWDDYNKKFGELWFNYASQTQIGSEIIQNIINDTNRYLKKFQFKQKEHSFLSNFYRGKKKIKKIKRVLLYKRKVNEYSKFIEKLKQYKEKKYIKTFSTNNFPKISVIMSSYNRAQYIKEAIESILNQTYQDFELIIIDDCSKKETQDVIEKYAQNDKRIIFLKNEHNMGQVLTRNRGLEIAKGEYIAILDDDDISLPTRFEKQVEYMDKNPDIMLSGTDIQTFDGDGTKTSWVDLFDPEIISVLINFYNPFCASTLIFRNDFIKKHNIKYDNSVCHAEDYDLYRQFLVAGGKISNLPQVLVKYRVHNQSITHNKKSQKIQILALEKVKQRLLSRFFDNKTVKKIIKTINFSFYYPNNKKDICKYLMLMKKNNNNKIVNNDSIDRAIELICGKSSIMDIFFSSNDNYSQYLCVSIASILINSLPIENFNFYVLDGGIQDKNKEKILNLKKIKNFNIEFIKVDDNLFKDCDITSDCLHISKQTYYRYIIPKLKPQIKKCLYLDCDIIVNDSLNELWNINLEDNYVAAVEDLFLLTDEDAKRLNVNHYFNAGVLLINNELWIKDNISELLFENTLKIKDKIRWVDQCVLNYTFKDKVLFISPKYNLQHSAYKDTKYNIYNKDQIDFAQKSPIIIHYSGSDKPWSKKCTHHLWKQYYKYLKYTPYKNIYYTYKFKKFIKSFFKSIFSIQNIECYKLVKFFGLKFYIKNKQKEYMLKLENDIKNDIKNIEHLINRNKVYIDDIDIKIKKNMLQNSKLWDAQWYLKTYGYNYYKTQALDYYIETGWKQKESPSKYFNTEYYLLKYGNTLNDEIPVIHYLTKGKYWCYYLDNKNNYKSKFDKQNIQNYLEYKNNRNAKGVIYTCITNDYDDIYEIETYKYVNKDWDYVCFTDNQEHIEQKQIGIWQIKPLVYKESDNTRNNRWHKLHPHILFPEYEKSIYIDANINILSDKLFNIINKKNTNIVLPEHFNTSCIYQELNWALNSGIDNYDIISEQYELIKNSNMPKNYGFTENNLIYRKHNEKNVIDLMDEWWYMVSNYSKRDQLSFVYLLWKRQIDIEDITFKNTRIDDESFYVFDHKKTREHVHA